MKKIWKKTAIGILLLFVISAAYIVWDNNRITVAEQDISIESLPKAFDGFRILQVSDLQEKRFGSRQSKLVEAINAIDYDAIVFTGDMMDSTESTDFTPFYALLEGITNKKNAWYVAGNDDPYNYTFNPEITKSKFIKGVEKRGVKLLESVDAAIVDKEKIQFVNFEQAIIKSPEHVGRNNGIVTPPYESNEKYITYQKQLWKEMKEMEEDDTVIALNHYPVADPRMDYIQQSPNKVLHDIDLLLVGHYHGGQIRLPLIGALFVPEPWYDSPLFPPKDRVKGLWEYKDIKQYVSTGLGSSDAIPFLKFRLFNPPEVNLITLKR